MKILISLFLVLSLSGCATAIPVTYQEQCAEQGLVFAGISMGNSTAVAYGMQTGTTVVRSHGSSTSCVPPKDLAEQTATNKLAYNAEPKFIYNENLGMKRFVTGIGYFMYLLPGIAFLVIFDKDRTHAIQESDARYASVSNP